MFASLGLGMLPFGSIAFVEFLGYKALPTWLILLGALLFMVGTGLALYFRPEEDSETVSLWTMRILPPAAIQLVMLIMFRWWGLLAAPVMLVILLTVKLLGRRSTTDRSMI